MYDESIQNEEEKRVTQSFWAMCCSGCGEAVSEYRVIRCAECAERYISSTYCDDCETEEPVGHNCKGGIKK